MKKVLEKQRNSTIELLRILCILMIVFMHLVGIWWDYCDNLFDKEFVIFVNSLCNCAVTILKLTKETQILPFLSCQLHQSSYIA